MPNTIEATLTGSTGPAFVERNGQRIAINEGDSIYEADLIITGPETTIDISYRDGTKSRIGPDSEMRLVDFEFGPSEEPSFIVNLTQGAMRTVSGDIVKLNPEAFEVVTPRATVGIRGTEFVTQVGEESDTHVVLYIKNGHIMMVTGQDGSSVTFDRPLQMTTVDGSGGALHVKEYSLEQMQDLMNALAPSFGNNIPKSEAEQGNFPHLTRNTRDDKKDEEEKEDKEKSESNNQNDTAVSAEGQNSSENNEGSEQAQNSSSSTSTEQALEEVLADSNAVDVVYDNEDDLNTLLAALKEAGILVNSTQAASVSSQNDMDSDTDSVIENVLEAEHDEAENTDSSLNGTLDTDSTTDSTTDGNPDNTTDNNIDNNTDSNTDNNTDNKPDSDTDVDAPTTYTFDTFAEDLVMGSESNTVTITTFKSGSLDTGAGDDIISIGSQDDGTLISGAGDDFITIGPISAGSIEAGDGNDFIKIGTCGSSVTIDGGDDFDILVVSNGTPNTTDVEVTITDTYGKISSVESLSSYGVTVDNENSRITLDSSWNGSGTTYTHTNGLLTINVAEESYIATVSA